MSCWLDDWSVGRVKSKCRISEPRVPTRREALEKDDDEGATDSKTSDANAEKTDGDDDTDDTSDNKESTSIIINNEVVKKPALKALKARKDATNRGKKLIGREAEQGAAAQIKHHGKIDVNSGSPAIHGGSLTNNYTFLTISKMIE